MQVTEIPIGQVRMRFRLRTPKEEKIAEIASSIKQLGLLNPITVTSDNYLIAGFHRLHACKMLEHETIPAIIKDTTKVYGELMEIDENLKRNELNHIEIAEHMVRREELLETLGIRMKKGGNQYTEGNMVTTNELAEEIGLSNRVYRLKRQPSKINEEARDLLRDTPWADNLMDMVKLSQQEHDLQLKIAHALCSGKHSTFKRAFVETSLEEHNLTRTRVVDFDLKERWGIPQTIMRFKKADVELQTVCNKVSKDPELEWTKREGIHFGTSRIPVYQMAADHAEFLVTYYTPPNGIILDNFMGRGTIGLASMWHGRKFIGYDVEKKNVDRMREVVDETFPESKDDCKLFHSDGVLLKELEDESNYLDAVVTDPPYVLHAEKYTSDDRDISGYDHQKYMSSIKENFQQLHRLIKPSNFDEKVFHPVIFKVGTGRRGTMGIVDMDADFQYVAKECGFVLWDKLYNHLASPWAAVNWERNYKNKYVQKNYETNLVFCKFK
tara:strand:+ start:752 stop:2242 length:1491 start_codon:yes stop_codon:yes gene_type:complete